MIRSAVQEVIVNTGEVKYRDYPAIFASSGVGSCVVVFIYDSRKKIGGVAHIMLPRFTELHNDNEGLFANTSTSLLINNLINCGADVLSLRAKIIGGANLFEWAEAVEFRELGRSNIENVKKELLRQKIYLAAEEVGGTSGKAVKCCTSTGNVFIKSDKTGERII